MPDLTIRETTSDDVPDLMELYPQAFPDEELRPIVQDLLAMPTQTLSLGGFENDRLVGHVLFTLCDTEMSARRGALLGPLCAAPDRHKQGIGSALVRDGLSRLQAMQVQQVVVLGDPRYYGRFGFAPERQVNPPYPMPDEWADAWQSLSLAGQDRLESSTLTLPAPWMQPALWWP